MRLALVFVFGISLSSALNYAIISSNYLSGMGRAVASVMPTPMADMGQDPAVETEMAEDYSGVEVSDAPSPSPKPASVSGAVHHEEAVVSDDTIERLVKLSARRGDTMLSFLRRGGISAGEAYEVNNALSGVMKASELRSGQKMEVLLERSPQDPDVLVFKELKMLHPEKQVQVTRDAAGTLKAESVEKKLERQVVRAGGAIHSSLMGAAEDIGIPATAMQQVINAYSYDVDFQRDIQEGDRFEVVYESMQDEQGRHVRTGEVLFAKLQLSGDVKKIYYYTDKEGQSGFYTEDGKSVKRALLRTPINGARLSSGFGMRRHPVLGYSKMHRGVDFAAPTGTPIYAAGDGRVVEAGRKGSYGNYVRIRHNGEYSTAYAHLSRFAKGVKPGMRVKQGQVVAYVGTTGRSTGPHLHYEVLRSNAQINPMSVKNVSTAALTKRELQRFKREMERMESSVAALPMTTQVALAK